MLSTRHRFLFLHVPKTAGNAVQTWLLPHSDDQKVTHRHQDGIERFYDLPLLRKRRHRDPKHGEIANPDVSGCQPPLRFKNLTLDVSASLQK